MLVYNSINGQSFYDICLMTYGTLDYLDKLISDNNFESIDSDIPIGTVFSWDETLTVNQTANRQLSNSNIILATKA